jgi:large repetitive protein
MSITVDLNGAAGGTSAITAFTEQTIVSLFPSATISTNGSPDSNSIDTVTITLASPTAAAEILSLNAAASAVATAADITVTYNSGVLTLSGSNELTSQWQTILQGVQYNNTSDSPTGPTRTVTVVATNTGTNNSSRQPIPSTSRRSTTRRWRPSRPRVTARPSRPAWTLGIPGCRSATPTPQAR